VQHLVIFSLDLSINEFLPIDAVIGEAPRDSCKTFPLHACENYSAEHLYNYFKKTYVDPGTSDDSIHHSHQRRPVARPEHGCNVA
jgi:hypothetical protein